MTVKDKIIEKLAGGKILEAVQIAEQKYGMKEYQIK